MGFIENASHQQIETIITESSKAFYQFKKVSRYTRSRLLTSIAKGIESKRAEIVKAIVDEVYKPVTLAEGEVNRAITTFQIAAEEAKRYGGEIVPLDIDAGGRSYSSATSTAISLLTPRGPVLAISPFNFPLNLVAHKVAPALAVGASVILKPPPQAPTAAKILLGIFEAACVEVSDAKETIPLTAFQVFTASNDVVAKVVGDSRITTLSFTGSNKVGWMLQSQAIRKKVCLELGGDAAVIVHRDANISRAVSRSVWGSFAFAGQVCISVQRIFTHRDIAKEFEEKFISETKQVGVGDPWGKETLVGPLIDQKAVDRILDWIDEAVQGGAVVLCGGKLLQKKGAYTNPRILEPTVLKNVPINCKLSTEEAFGPVVILNVYDNLSEVIREVNTSQFGLHAGVFTDSMAVQNETLRNLDVGGVIFNDVPTFRADNMPYGGVKESGIGREGVKYTMEEFSERKTAVYWNE